MALWLAADWVVLLTAVCFLTLLLFNDLIGTDGIFFVICLVSLRWPPAYRHWFPGFAGGIYFPLKP